MATSFTDSLFNYIIVGGGTSGLTIASRLSEDPRIKVLVVEAGANHMDHDAVITPGLLTTLYGNSNFDWNFKSIPQPELNNRCLPLAQGKQLGGSSAINCMMMTYPSRGIFDTWAALGNDGWNYECMKPYFEKFATYHPPPEAAKAYVELADCGENRQSSGSGPVQVSFSEGYGTVNLSWMETFSSLGLTATAALRSGMALGAFQQPASIDPATKTRSYSATAYYTPEISERPNLTVLTETVAKRIILDRTASEPIAAGVLVQRRDGKVVLLTATEEVILAAGALKTPQLLEISGIGSKSILDAANIPVTVDSPGVGENLQDHPVICQSFEVKEHVPSSDSLRSPGTMDKLLQQYQSSREGPMGQSNLSVAYAPLSDFTGRFSQTAKDEFFTMFGNYAQSKDSGALLQLLASSDEPLVEYLLFPGQTNTAILSPSSLADYHAPFHPGKYVSILTLLNYPFSRGNVHISSADVFDQPVWNPNFCTNQLDLEIALRHVQFIEKFVKTAPFSELLQPNGSRIPSTIGTTREEAVEIIRQTQISGQHVSGSCSMKPRQDGGVVDSRLRVYGVKGLRIADASVFPLIPSGNLQSVVYAVAEKAADLIKEDRT